MARTTAEALTQLKRFLPSRYLSIGDVLAGFAAAEVSVEETGEAFAEASTIGGAEDAILTLLAKTYGVNPTPNESAASIRARIRNVEGQVTRPAIVAAVNALLAEYTEDQAYMLEPWEDGFADYDAWADTTILSDLHNSFVLVVPLVGDSVSGSAYADTDYFDVDAYFGDGVESPVYAAIVALVERIRGAGIRWRLTIDS